MSGSEQRVLLLGPVRLATGGSFVDIAPKARLLVARLALAESRTVSSEALVDDLWDGDAPATARKSIQKYVGEVRTHLGEGSIRTEGPGYRLTVPSDVADVEDLIQGARAAIVDGRPAQAAPLLHDSLSLFRGRPLQDLEDVPFVADETRRIEEMRISIEENLAEVELDLGRHSEAADRLDRLVRKHPMRERLVAALMIALYRGGRHTDALSVYRQHTRILGEELGLEPGPQLAELEERILVHDPALAPAVRRPSRRQPQSIAILPFADLSENQDQAYFAEGIGVEVIRMLSRLDGLRVASRGSSFAYRDSPLDIRRIGSELGVTSILEGSVRRQDDRVRITVGLTDALEGFQLWGETYDRALDDIFAIQEEIAVSVVDALVPRLSPEAEMHSVAPGTAAYDLYLQGRHHFYRGGLSETKQAIRLFQQATLVAPNYCLALAGLADASSFLHLYYERDPKTLAAAEEYGRLAVASDDSMAETHASLGFALGAAGRYDEARASFLGALSLPGGRFETAYLFGRTLFCAGEMDDANDMFSRAIETRPEEFHAAALLAKTLRAVGKDERSRAMQRRVLDLVEHHLRLVPDDARALGDGALALVALGRIGEGARWAGKALEARHSPMPYYAASALAMAGLVERAFEAIEQIIDAGWSHRDFLLHDPDWDGLRTDDRFEGLLSRLA